jgi:hypothetical protein
MRARHPRARSDEDADLPHEPSAALVLAAAALLTLLAAATTLLGA